MTQHDPEPIERRAEHLFVLVLAVGALVGSFLLTFTLGGGLELPLPGTGIGISLPGTCLSQRLFGIPCPGCGLTRSFVAMAHGHVTAAVNYNPMGPILFVLCLVQIPYRIAHCLGLGRTNRAWCWISNHGTIITWAVVLGLIGSWGVKVILF